ncbi:MAG TPA: hypothetical protein VF658_02165 [Pyrinomonadaceae bacterium]|jgi:hypothetical protein
MKKASKPARRKSRRRNERGAALISVLLISLLLLSAGGALILTTSMSATNAIDATAEMQAYYGAEAGMQAALNVLRGNVQPHTPVNPGLLGGLLGGVLNLVDLVLNNTLTFLGAVTPVSSNLDTDPKFMPDGVTPFPNRLSRWLVYDYMPPGGNYNDRVRVSVNYGPLSGAAYSVTVTDPDNTPPGRQPARLLIESTGYGPRGAQKKLTAIMSRYALDIPTPATLVMRGHDDGVTKMSFDIGQSYAKKYSGADRVVIGGESVKPSFAVSLHDVGVVQYSYKDKPETVNDPKFKVIPDPDPNVPIDDMVETPWFLKTTLAARAFLKQAKDLAAIDKRVFGSVTNFTAGTTQKPLTTYVDGDCELEGGAGLLIVTGKLTLKGGPNFDGIILVLGKGEVAKSGGGNGEFHGAMMVAKFDINGTGGFLAPKFEVAGGGGSDLLYDSRAIEMARSVSGHPVLGIFER